MQYKQLSFLILLVSILFLGGCVSQGEITEIKAALNAIDDYRVTIIKTDAAGSERIMIEEAKRPGQIRTEVTQNDIYDERLHVQLQNNDQIYSYETTEKVAYKDVGVTQTLIDSNIEFLNSLDRNFITQLIGRVNIEKEDVTYKDQEAIKLTVTSKVDKDKNVKQVMYLLKDTWLPLRQETYASQTNINVLEEFKEEFGLDFEISDEILQYRVDYTDWQFNVGFSEDYFEPAPTMEIIDVSTLPESERDDVHQLFGGTFGESQVVPFTSIKPTLNPQVYTLNNEGFQGEKHFTLKHDYTTAYYQYSKDFPVDGWDTVTYTITVTESPSYLVLTPYIGQELGVSVPTINNRYKQTQTVDDTKLRLLTYLFIDDVDKQISYVKNPETNTLEIAKSVGTLGKQFERPRDGEAAFSYKTTGTVTKYAYFKKGNLFYEVGVSTHLNSGLTELSVIQEDVLAIEKELEKDMVTVVRSLDSN